jgi:uncharacterized protein (DUF2147 family)
MKHILLAASILALSLTTQVYAKKAQTEESAENTAEAPAAKADNGVFGYWKTVKSPEDGENQVGYIHIRTCKSNPSKVCGYVVGGDTPIDPATGKAWLDKNNPEESLKTRPVGCLQTLSDFSSAGPNSYEDGTIYSAATGKTYSCSLELKDPNHLAVTGSVLFGAISKTFVWTRMSPAPKNPCQ